MKYQVILVEDDPDMQAYVAYCLSVEGHNVLVASNGQHALELLAALDLREIPPVAIVDVMMPVLDGIGLAQALEQKAFGAEMSLIFFTSMLQKPRVSFRGKSCLVLSKPNEIKELIYQISRILGDQMRNDTDFPEIIIQESQSIIDDT